MEVTLEVFRTAIKVLQNNNMEDLYNAIESLNNHLGVLEDNKDILVDKLKRSVVFYKKYENQMEWRKVAINSDRIHTWAPLLKEHQKANVFPDVKGATVSRLIDARNELDHISMSVSEIQMRLMERAREAKNILAEMEETKIKMFIMESSIHVAGFLNAKNYDVKEMADYEIDKIYSSYVKEVGAVG